MGSRLADLEMMIDFTHTGDLGKYGNDVQGCFCNQPASVLAAGYTITTFFGSQQHVY